MSSSIQMANGTSQHDNIEAYQAGLNPPGGFWSDDTGHKAGDPILHDVNHRRYKTFFCCNAFSFMSSIVVIMLLLSRNVFSGTRANDRNK
ncbi:hypothetical protein E2562_027709 [Oryza meyeriana var. granulata]|uniref:PGG domain-containing protein n=1 Tax=Oryza meyeriana var. granulata TaxID=110450 RepID=A0A6G1CU52_9ORYZ|nr:hypothetical protein E2562_027709 [Oryza meyeriana var. granulata]